MPFVTFRYWYALYLFKRAKYQFFLHVSEDIHSLGSHRVWAYYQLGMYKTVCNNIAYCSPLSTIAVAASLAACGKLDKSDHAIDFLVKNNPDYIEDLASALVPFYPVASLKLMKNHSANSLLKLSLLSKYGYKNLVVDNLNKLKVKNKKDYIEIHLLQAQLEEDGVWNALNKIYESLGLQKIQKKYLPQQFSVNNVQATNVGEKYFLSEKLSQCNLPIVSILVTTYNAEKYIASMLDSLLNQTYRSIEIIVVDDCSSDNTWDILISYCAKFSNIINIHRQTKNLGTYVAKNRALLYSKGDFVVCHDADDWSHPERILLQVNPLIQNKSLIATTSNWIRVSNNGEIFARNISPISRLNPSSLMFRKKVALEKIGFWDSVRTGADSEFLNRLKCYFGKKSIHKIDIPLAIGSHHPESLMNDPITGYISNAMPVNRLDYWESWRKWHLSNVSNRNALYLPPFVDQSQRPFAIPLPIGVDDSSLLTLKDIMRDQILKLES